MKVRKKPISRRFPAKKPLGGKKPLGSGKPTRQLKGGAKSKDLASLSTEVMSGPSMGKKEFALSQALLSAWK